MTTKENLKKQQEGHMKIRKAIELLIILSMAYFVIPR